ncbi:MBL fold metallo-hydrolase [Streptosporangium sp. NBC_01755]|uniref:MBL fold metallo-hydrolase n=1 Tax=unclassified Streptosporangium TaxID=2632669 RepID=UPI002DDB2DAF|nr:MULTISPECIES: MBL fold metallo-hydrolase [unclassified Streptosporangium]WSA23973.1 MBL fold metallo-hydrolase [Streptosporangium sp. NBC_01810]WSC97951.1 MBL fold metallo-hydrolase [Streptosporangium sp. NBC_01755]
MEGRWVEVADRVLVRRYAELDLSVGLVVGDGGCLVVDTRGDERQGAELLAEVRRITRAPWTVAITHSHFDHSFGTRPFLGCPVWAHEGCRTDLVENGGRARDEWARHYRDRGRADIAGDIARTEIALPDHLVTDRAELVVGGRPVVLAHLGRGHSGNDLVVHVPDAGVVFAGDLVENGAPPAYEDAYPLEWPATLAGLLDLLGDSDSDTGGIIGGDDIGGIGGVIVPGHGDPVDRAFAAAQHAEVAALARLCERVAAGLLSPADAVRLSPYPEETTRTALGRPC